MDHVVDLNMAFAVIRVPSQAVEFLIVEPLFVVQRVDASVVAIGCRVMKSTSSTSPGSHHVALSVFDRQALK